MKKLLFMVVILCGVLFSQGKLKVLQDLNIRADHSIKSEIVDTIKKGEVVNYSEIFSDYVFVDIIKGEGKKSTSDHVRKRGWIWSERVYGNYIIIEGVTLRSSPDKPKDNTPAETRDDKNFVAKIKKGAKVKIGVHHEVWVKIESGWVSFYYVKLQ